MLRASEDIYAIQASILRTLGSARRLEIIHLLGEGPTEVHRIAEALGVSQPTISHHMAVLWRAGLIQAEKQGQWMWYRRDESALRDFFQNLREDL